MTLPKLYLEPDEPAYSVTIGNEVLSVSVNNGPSRRRRDFIGSPHMVPIQFVLMADEYQYLMAFYRYTLQFGVLSFLMDLIIDSGAVEEYECSFVAESFGLAGKQGEAFIVKATIEAQKKAIDPEFDIALLDLFDIYGSGSAEILALLAKLVNVDLPEALG